MERGRQRSKKGGSEREEEDKGGGIKGATLTQSSTDVFSNIFRPTENGCLNSG
ncbi:hypothetical protein SK128_010070 [Halocaridina rubra]|uniref:Uncharacterized protein n=1 Tax=Halocaridina rubra TaxID=373956 RepID=A0AAN8XDK2_HALRR